MGDVMSTQVITYTAPGTVYYDTNGNPLNAANPQTIAIVVYNGMQCTGSIMSIQTYVSSTNYCFNNNQVIYASGAVLGRQDASTVAAINQFLPANQQTNSIPSLFQINSYYTSLTGCQGSNQGSLTLAQYQPTGYLQGTNGVCANPVVPYSPTSPAFWSSPLCTTATSTIPNNFAILSYFDDDQCTVPLGQWGWQLNVCYVTGAASSVMYTSTTLNGVTSLFINTYATNTCAGASTFFTKAQYNSANEATTNCYPYIVGTSGTWSSKVRTRFTLSSTVGTSQTGTPNTGTQNGYQWVVRYNSQQACQSNQVSAAPRYEGVLPVCVPFTAFSPTTGAQVQSGYFISQQLQACSAPNPTATPSAAPNNAPSSASSSPACFAATEQVALENGATKAIADVVVGDRILTVNTKTGAQVYSDVAYVPHGKNAEKAVFTVLATEAGRDVKMTANHMLPAGACDAAGSLPVVAASTISAGDCVQTVSGRERVVSVGTVAGEGIYTVIAMEELIVVNGVVATPYGGVNPTLANVYYNLHRLAYSVVGKALLAMQDATEGVWAALAFLAASH